MRVFALMAFLLLIAPAGAQYFDRYSIDVNVDGGATETVKIDLTNDIQVPIDSIGFRLAKGSEVLAAEGARHEVTESGDGVELRLFPTKPIAPGGNASMGFMLKADNLISRNGDNEIFKLVFSASSDIGSFSISVRLPKGGNVVTEDGTPLASPQPVLSTDGERIMVSWKKPLNAKETFSAFVLFSRQEQSRLMLVPLVLLPLAMIGAVWYYRRKTIRIVEVALEEDARKIFEHIREKGEVTQDDVVHFTQFSKSKVSKLIRRLEERKMIEKEPYKKTNKLRVAKNLRG